MFAEKRVVAELKKMVTVRIVDDWEGKPNRTLALRYEVHYYPTMVLLAPDGREVDRLVGARAADSLLRDLARIRRGDTTARARSQLDAGKGSHAQLELVARDLLCRGRAVDAVRLREEFHRSSNDRCCALAEARLRFQIQRELYRDAITALSLAGRALPVVPPEAHAPALSRLLSHPGLRTIGSDRLVAALRESRKVDAAVVLAEGWVGASDAADLEWLAETAYATGNYPTAASFYHEVFQDLRQADPWSLANAAESLYLTRTDLDDALHWARFAHRTGRGWPIASIYARLLYLLGSQHEARGIVRAAAHDELARGNIRAARLLAKLLRSMQTGKGLYERPPFESFGDELLRGEIPRQGGKERLLMGSELWSWAEAIQGMPSTGS